MTANQELGQCFLGHIRNVTTRMILLNSLTYEIYPLCIEVYFMYIYKFIGQFSVSSRLSEICPKTRWNVK